MTNMKHDSQRGYTLLFAVLTATLVLGVAVFILNISRKQFILSSTARDSMFSLYAADSGIECVAAHKDLLVPATPANKITCDNQSVDISFVAFPSPGYVDASKVAHADAQIASFKFGFSYTPLGALQAGAPGTNGCAKVDVITYADTVNSGTVDRVIDSRGYNFCDSTFEPKTSNARTVERELELTF